MKFEPPIYAWGSDEYEGYVAELTEATAIQNLRNRYTEAMRSGKPNPFDFVPRKPTHAELAVIDADRQWKAALKGRSDRWWFRRIDAAIEECFYLAKTACLIWWDLCNAEDLDADKWHERFHGYDFDADLFTDLDVIEYALHCCGFPPAKARKMVFDAKDRKKWRVQRLKIYDCGCGAVLTNCSCPPVRCLNCGDHKLIIERKQS